MHLLHPVKPQIVDPTEIIEQYADQFDDGDIPWADLVPTQNDSILTSADEDDSRTNRDWRTTTLAKFSEMVLTVNRQPFSLVGREYLEPVYNVDKHRPAGSRNIILIAGRQVEKTELADSKVLMANGSVKKLEDIQVGDEVCGLDPDEAHTAMGKVTWKSELYHKPCIRIRTRQGHTTSIALTHPMRTWDSWTEGGRLAVKDRLAVVRRAGAFTGSETIEDEWLIICANMIAEGHNKGTPNYTQLEGLLLDEFILCCKTLSLPFTPSSGDCKGGLCWRISLTRGSNENTNRVREALKKWNIYGKTSGELAVPDFVFDLDRRQTALFLNRLWAGDGHASLQDSSYHLEYDSTSPKLCRSIQRLLWKFGIPTSMRRWKPTLYEGTDKWAYKLRVETQEGALTFISDIGALGKTEDLPILSVEQNNNRDTYPIEIQNDIQSIYYDGMDGKQGRSRKGSLHASGLRNTLKYPPSKEKLQSYVDFFRADDRFDKVAVDQLAVHLTTDLFWDEIVAIEDLGEQPCYDITVEGTDSFIADGFVTHNSTTLAGKAIVLGARNPAFFTLTIQPRFGQVKVFSQQRFGPMCEDSEALRKFWLSNKCLWQVSAREFRNRSFWNFRSCFYSADAIRGVTAHHLQIDELQDIISDNIPVLEECQSHFPIHERFNLYAGTPKTTSNTLNLWWNESSQMEWLVSCTHCSHYNYLDEKVIGLHHYICTRCGKQIYPRNGGWYPQKMSKVDECWGFRISQIMAPFMTHSEVKKKMDNPNISRRVFFNECLGLPYDEGELVLTKNDMMAACEPDREASKPDTMWRWQVPICCGVDHGTGGYSAVDPVTGLGRQGGRSRTLPSFTVVAFGAYCADGIFRIFKIVKFVGEMANLAKQPMLINDMIREWGGQWVMSDWGFGAQTNQSLITNHNWQRMEDGTNPLLMEIQYVRSTKLVYFHPTSYRYMVDRNYAIEQTVDAIKCRKIRFFRWNEMEDYADDFTSIYVEYDHNLNRIKYDHILPDDCFHAVAYAYLCARQRAGNLVSTGVPND